jgi:small GTP-binding protein
MLGAFAVGKTSLVARFVDSIFSDQYLTTVGVKTDKKTVMAGGKERTLIIWDVSGEDEFRRVEMSYLRGASGYLLVADCTRRFTIDIAFRIQQDVENTFGPIPFVLVINKSDLTSEWEIDASRLVELTQNGWTVIMSSALTGQGVEEAFLTLTNKILGI